MQNDKGAVFERKSYSLIHCRILELLKFKSIYPDRRRVRSITESINLLQGLVPTKHNDKRQNDQLLRKSYSLIHCRILDLTEWKSTYLLQGLVPPITESTYPDRRRVPTIPQRGPKTNPERLILKINRQI
jgi:hypothetical protein